MSTNEEGSRPFKAVNFRLSAISRLYVILGNEMTKDLGLLKLSAFGCQRSARLYAILGNEGNRDSEVLPAIQRGGQAPAFGPQNNKAKTES